MEFNVYYVIPEIEIIDDDPIEIGLSPGELRQSILDRARVDVEENDLTYIRATFDALNIPFSLTNNNEENDDYFVRAAMEEIETILYDLDDSFFHETIWQFRKEIIKILNVDFE